MTTTKLLGKTPILIAFALLASALQIAAATLTVTNAKDSGAGSLRAAVEKANTNAQEDTINFDPTFFNTQRTITLTSGEILITPDDQNGNGRTGRLVTINGPGANLLTISGGNASRIFLLAGNPGQEQQNANVTMSGMTLRDGNGVGGVSNANGGAIFAQLAANLTLNSMVIRNNVITTLSSGGGIFINFSNIVINDSLITENSAFNAGGIFSGSENRTFTMRNTIVSNNRATSGSVGGVNVIRGTNVITNCQITGNTATAAIGGINFFQAGLIDMSDTTISSNMAGAGVNGAGSVGGISTDGAAVATFRRVTISNNSVKGDTGGMNIRNPGGIVTIIDSTVSNNTSSQIQFVGDTRGGGIVISGESNSPTRIINTTISGNSASNQGGGILNFSHGLELINSTVVNNSINNSRSAGQEGGGGIFDGQQARSGTFGFRVKLQNSIIAGNTAPTGPDLFSGFDSSGYNIIGNTAGTNNSTAATGDQFDVDPLVGPLADNGGATLTHALLPGSPAIDKGKSADVITDQRGLPRPFNNPSIPNAAGGDGADIGAFEDQPANTSTGSNVTVEAPAGDASATFASVSKAGFTILAEIEPPSAAGTPPTGYTIMEEAPAYDITTTATFKAPITVCFTVNAIAEEAVFARVRVLHGENGVLVDRTDLSSLDFGSRTVCAQVNSPSPFVIALAPLPTNTLLNISTRLRVDTGDNALIGGFIVAGAAPKTVLIRAIGPSLPVPDKLGNPTLELFGPAGMIASNDDWMDAPNRQEIMKILPPISPKESAILVTLPGDSTGYTAIVRGAGGGVGVALVEVYDLSPGSDTQLANISTRGLVQTGDNVLIGGFILGGDSGSAAILVRALGPSLPSSVANRLANPTLEVRDANGALVRSNDDWTKSAQKGEIEDTGIPREDDLESAVVGTLSPGAYTAIVSGKNGGTGVGLVEVYRLP